MRDAEYQELVDRERHDDAPLTAAERFLLNQERQRRGAPSSELAALEDRQAAGELNALEAFRLRKERQRREAKPNQLEALAAAYRRNPLTGKE